MEINPANMDTTVKPGDDFYKYANGNWMKNNPIPDAYSRYGVFEVLEEQNRDNLKTIFDEVSKDKKAKQGSIQQKIRDFYNSAMDTVSIEKAGISPLKAELDKINAFAGIKDIQKFVTEQHVAGNYPLFTLYSAQDDKNSNNVIANTFQGGLGLPDRDYYLDNDARSKEIRAAYEKHIENMMKIAGYTPEQAIADAKNVLKIETQLAKISSTRIDLRDPNANYNKTDLAGIQKMAPEFDWDGYFKGLGVTATQEINVGQPKFMSGMAKMLKSIPVAEWKSYFRWDLINNAANSLSSAFEKEHFAFYSATLRGIKEPLPRWKRMISATSNALGEAVGQLYVEKYFPAEAKEKMLTLVNNLKASLSERINIQPWMSDATKKEAQEKLKAINVKVGYPDKWIDYSKLEIKPDSYYQNLKNASIFETKRSLAKIGKPVDRSEWGMNPQTVNAYYSPNMNEIVFPAAILQPPFFFMKGDDAVNYGAIGMVISHEMTHGFDDQGRQYDKEGNLKEWWTAQDAQNFKEKAQPIIAVYDNYKMLDSLHVSGKLTLGENIADMGGLNIAYNGFLKSQGDKKDKVNDKNNLIEGFTPAQRFFLSYAQVWRGNIRDKELMRRIKEDVHSPAEARINCVVYNMPQFYEAFAISPSDKRYVAPEKRATIW